MPASKRWGLLLIALSLVRGLLYSAVLPPWQGPDEPQHYEYVRLLYEKGRLVQWGDSIPAVEQEVLASMERFDFWRTGRYLQPGATFAEVWGASCHQLHQPPLAYLLYLGPLLLAPEDINLHFYLMRVLSVLLGVVVVVAAVIAASTLRDLHPVLSWSVPAFIVFLPTYTSLSGMVNSDHLVEAAVSLVLALWLVALKSGLSILLTGGLVVFSMIGLLAKRTALVLLPMHLVAVILYLRVHHPSIFSKRNIAYTFGVAGLVLGFMIWLGGHGLAWLSQRAPAVAEWLVKLYLFLPSEQFPFSPNQSYFSAEALGRYVAYARFLFETFWGRFALFQVQWPPAFYILAAGLSLVALAGLVLFVGRVIRGVYQISGWLLASLALLAFSVATMIVMVYANEIRRWDLGWGGWPQARYLFVVIIPIAALFVQGWSEVVPQRYRTAWVSALLVVLLLLDIFSIVFLIIPYFYG
jgi:hypothetical protein